MAWDVASFKAAYPEFEATPDAIVLRALTDATKSNDPAVFGSKIDRAVALTTAHDLSLSSFGTQSRLGTDSARTTYLAEWERLAQQCAGGAWLL